MTTYRDNFWLWGQDAGSHHTAGRGGANVFKLPGQNRMDPAEGGHVFGIPNCCRVAMPAGPTPPFDREAEKLHNFKQVVWSAVGASGVVRNDNNQSDLDEILRQAEIWDNVTGAVLDDFFKSVESQARGTGLARHSVESIREMRDRLHSFPRRRLDLWMVWYKHQLDLPVADYIDLCDVVTLWTWKGSDLAALDDNLEKFVTLSPGKRRLAGCYLWNYGEQCPLTPEQMQYQLERYEEWIHCGKIEGIVLCSNSVADIGLDTVATAKQWIERVGEREFAGYTEM